MSRHQSAPRVTQAVAEEQVAGFFGVLGFELRTGLAAADFLKCAGKAERISCELHGGSVRQKFALPGNRALNQTAKENADPPNDY